jgi:hypothetical protein
MKLDEAITLYRSALTEFEGAKKTLVVRALAACQRIQSASTAIESDLKPIVNAATSKYIRVWEIGTHLLHLLAVNHDAAQRCLRTMMASRSASIRFRVMALLRFSSVSESIASEFVQLALDDRSCEVRGLGADAAGHLRLRKMLPALRRAHVIEKHRPTKDGVFFVISLLQDGYFLQREKSKPPVLYVLFRGKKYYWRSFYISEEDTMQPRLNTIIKQANRSPFSWHPRPEPFAAADGGRDDGS